MRRIAPVVGAVLVLLAAGCSGVPSSSKPELIKEVAGGAALPTPVAAPTPGADPSAIVSGFLAANFGAVDSKHQAARQYLTPDTASKWVDTNVTVISGVPQFSPFVPAAGTPATGNRASGTLTVTVQKVGSINSSGIYLPALPTAGTAPVDLPLSFGMARVSGQWRISSVTAVGVMVGVIVQASQLGSSGSSTYKLHPLYFLDPTGKHLVADLRYTALSGAPLAKWLLGQLLGPPRQELASAVQSLPDRINVKGADVTLGAELSVELPGSSQLDPDARTRLASQLANTFAQNAQPATVVITDGGRVVPYKDQLLAPAGALNDPPLFYLVNGSVRQLNGQPVDGPLGKPSKLTSVAVAVAPTNPSNYLVAGVVAAGTASKLQVGSISGGLRDTRLTGVLTRPTWAAEQSEVWVGSGPSLWRQHVGDPSRIDPPARVSINYGGAQGPQIRAVRISPDGARIALVLSVNGGPAAAYVSTIIRQGGAVQLSAPEPVSPTNIDITDLDWNNETTLYVIGVASGASGFGVWSVQQDGSAWEARSRTGLPSAPDSIAAAPGAVPWVSAARDVYSQGTAPGADPGWVSPIGPPDLIVPGTAPTFLE